MDKSLHKEKRSSFLLHLFGLLVSVLLFPIGYFFIDYASRTYPVDGSLTNLSGGFVFILVTIGCFLAGITGALIFSFLLYKDYIQRFDN